MDSDPSIERPPTSREDAGIDTADAALLAVVRVAPDDLDAHYDLDGLASAAGVEPALLRAIARSGLLQPHHVDGTGTARYSAADLDAVRAGLQLLDAGLPLGELLELGSAADRALTSVAESSVEAFLSFVRDPALGSTDDDRAAGTMMVDAYQRMLPALQRLTSHHLRRRVIQIALQRLEEDPSNSGGDG